MLSVNLKHLNRFSKKWWINPHDRQFFHCLKLPKTVTCTDYNKVMKVSQIGYYLHLKSVLLDFSIVTLFCPNLSKCDLL